MTAKKKSPSHDSVNSPAHYMASHEDGVECIDAIQSSMSPEAFAGYLKGSAMAYLWRYEAKGQLESLQKAQWYQARLIKHVEEWGV